MFKKIAAVALAATSFAASAASTNLLVNGSFESNTLASGHWTTVYSTTGWTVASAGLELRNDVAGTAEDGNNFAELDTSRNSSISQTVTGLTSGTYELSFWVEDRAGTASSTNGISYTINGVTYTVDPTTTTNGWVEVTQTFSASGSVTISFAATGTSDGYGSSLDNVSLTQLTSTVPEPASMMLLAAGLGLVGLARRRQAR